MPEPTVEDHRLWQQGVKRLARTLIRHVYGEDISPSRVEDLLVVDYYRQDALTIALAYPHLLNWRERQFIDKGGKP